MTPGRFYEIMREIGCHEKYIEAMQKIQPSGMRWDDVSDTPELRAALKLINDVGMAAIQQGKREGWIF